MRIGGKGGARARTAKAKEKSKRGRKKTLS